VKMASSSLYKLLTALSCVCFVLSLAIVFIPIWGYFEDSGGGFGSDRGYFSPWYICKELTYNREKCGSTENVSRFRPSKFVLASGVMLVISTIALGIYFILTAMQLIGMRRERSRKPNSSLIETRLVLAGLAALTAVACAGMFLVQSDDIRRGFSVTRGVSFYLLLVEILLAIVLSIMSFHDYNSSRQAEDVQSIDRGTRV